MKGLGIFGIVSLLLIAVLGVYSCTILQEYEGVQKKIQQDFVDAAARLQSLPESELPATTPAPLFESWLEIREIVTKVMNEGLADTKAITNLLVRRVRNDALKTLATELEERKIGFQQYCSLQRRFHSWVARPEQEKLRAAWMEKVRVARPPEPFALPDPAKTISKEELALLAKNEARLIESMQADKLTKLLELIETGDKLTAEPVEE